MMVPVMSAACWFTMVLLMFFPASAIARIAPGPAHLSAARIITLFYPKHPPTSSISDGINVQAGQAQVQEQVHNITIFGKKDKSTFHGLLVSRRTGRNRPRRLVGSSPPTCVGRCGACVPCMPVNVVITSPHPVISETDYYPEVWRCFCGNTYYLP